VRRHIAILTTACTAFAGAALATNYSADGMVTGMFSGAGNVVGVYHSAVWFNLANCPNGATEKAYLFDYNSTQDMSKVYATLLSAYTSDRPVRIGVSQTQCFAGYPVIERVAFVLGY
jgi:hypothetical protein